MEHRHEPILASDMRTPRTGFGPRFLNIHASVRQNWVTLVCPGEEVDYAQPDSVRSALRLVFSKFAWSLGQEPRRGVSQG